MSSEKAKTQMAAWHAKNRKRRNAEAVAREAAKRRAAGIPVRNGLGSLGGKSRAQLDRESYLRHPGRHKARAALWRAACRKAQPPWASPRRMAVVYDTAAQWSKDLGVAFHVDHVVPLRSKLVCGLHCEANMRIIPGSLNVRKSNRTWPDMP